MLTVETSMPEAPSGGGLLRIVADELWRGRAETVDDALAYVRSRLDGLHERLSPLPNRVRADVVVDGKHFALDVLAQPERWVGRATMERWDLALEGLVFPMEELELVRIHDLEPYVLGSRHFEGPSSI